MYVYLYERWYYSYFVHGEPLISQWATLQSSFASPQNSDTRSLGFHATSAWRPRWLVSFFTSASHWTIKEHTNNCWDKYLYLYRMCLIIVNLEYSIQHFTKRDQKHKSYNYLIISNGPMQNWFSLSMLQFPCSGDSIKRLLATWGKCWRFDATFIDNTHRCYHQHWLG